MKPAAHIQRKEKFVDLRWENKEGRTGLKRHEQIGDENKKKRRIKQPTLKGKGRVDYTKEEREKKRHSFSLHYILEIDKKNHMQPTI